MTSATDRNSTPMLNVCLCRCAAGYRDRVRIYVHEENASGVGVN